MTKFSNRVRHGAVSFTLMTAAAALATTASAGNHSKKSTHSVMTQTVKATPTSGTIVDAAVATPQLSTLVAAVTTAGLAGTLSGDGPFTVFAPTDSAFADLPAGTVETLLKPENRDKLTNILTSHVVAGNLSAQDILAKVQLNGGKAYVRTLSGAKLKAYTYNGALYIKDEQGRKSTVTKADIMKENGTVHVINGVILPAAKKKHSS